ncbi:MAG TPA: hypothetical protein VJ734_01555 [Nitrosospira sp.]|nr:hypothetical protein [Nitrosospira sp.]
MLEPNDEMGALANRFVLPVPFTSSSLGLTTPSAKPIIGLEAPDYDNDVDSGRLG